MRLFFDVEDELELDDLSFSPNLPPLVDDHESAPRTAICGGGCDTLELDDFEEELEEVYAKKKVIKKIANRFLI